MARVGLVWMLALALYGTAEAAPEPSIAFFVYHHTGKGPLAGWPGLEAIRVGADGVVRLGLTDAGGTISIPKREIFAPGAVAILFCVANEPHFCAAVRVDSASVKRLDELPVQLPVPELVDTYKITPR